MTTSGHASPANFLPRRRSLLLGALLGGGSAAALTGLSGGTAAAGSTDQRPAQIDFDIETGNFLRDLVSSQGRAEFEEFVAPMDVTIVQRITHLTTLAWFDAIAPYHPTAVGIYSRVGRRPASESATNRNMNVAALHASYHVTVDVAPEREPAFRQLLTLFGLDPDDTSEDPTTPVGIGNLAGKAVAAAHRHDGMNQVGDEGRTYNPTPFEDYTGYQPVNTVFELVDPSRWQPALTPHSRRQGGGKGDKGAFTVQHHITPQLRLTKAHTFDDPDEFTLDPPTHIDHTRPGAYRKTVDEVLQASAALTDEQKTMAEFFDNKLLGIGESGRAAAEAHLDPADVHGWVHMFLTMSVSIYDALIAVWHQKIKYDAVRPFSAIRHLYGSGPVTAWGGPGKGTVDDLPADEWASWLAVGDHSEYPSGSTTLCSAEAQAARRFFDDDVLELRESVPAGATLREPGITPASDVELYWETWTAFVEDCAASRVWGGVHYAPSVQRAVEFGRQFGDRGYEFVQRYVRGDVEK